MNVKIKHVICDNNGRDLYLLGVNALVKDAEYVCLHTSKEQPAKPPFANVAITGSCKGTKPDPEPKKAQLRLVTETCIFSRGNGAPHIRFKEVPFLSFISQIKTRQ